MAQEPRGTLRPMTDSSSAASDPFLLFLLGRASGMNFFQFARLLEERAPDRPGLGERDRLEEPVRFRSYPSMGFPASEMRAGKADAALGDPDAGLPPSVRTRFMGLYGVDAAIPSHLIDDIALRAEGHEAVAAFLDQFHHRLATHFYRAWKKYRYPVGFRQAGTDRRSRDLLALAGFGIGDKPRRAGLPPTRALGLLGLLNQRTRTAEGLAGAVALTVPGARVEVGEFEPVWTRVSDPARLSAPGHARGRATSTGLGRSTVLGRRIPYRSKAVKLTLFPADAHQTQALLPGGSLHADLFGIIRLYLGTKADVVLRLGLNTSTMPALRLGRVPPADCPDDGHDTDDAGEAPAPRISWTALLKPESERDTIIPIGRYAAIEPAPLAGPRSSPTGLTE